MNLPLSDLYVVLCPKCEEPVRVHAEPDEKVEAVRPPRCPDCKTSLGLQVIAVRAQIASKG